MSTSWMFQAPARLGRRLRAANSNDRNRRQLRPHHAPAPDPRREPLVSRLANPSYRAGMWGDPL
jgi:hypothetical protein